MLLVDCPEELVELVRQLDCEVIVESLGELSAVGASAPGADVAIVVRPDLIPGSLEPYLRALRVALGGRGYVLLADEVAGASPPAYRDRFAAEGYVIAHAEVSGTHDGTILMATPLAGVSANAVRLAYSLHAELASLERELFGAAKELNAARDATRGLQAQLADCRSRSAAQARALAHLQEQHEAVVASRIWRVTSPYRRLRAGLLLRRARRQSG